MKHSLSIRREEYTHRYDIHIGHNTLGAGLDLVLESYKNGRVAVLPL